ncbi:hypothetical protein GIW41_15865 [Pseudomonas sp. PA-6-1D]|uniref:hypothetical protein n=1 Tax=Pseudomonas TaxID=286 RepID=UPI001EF15E73|nr:MULTISPECIES: hypothetical protein [Pseudomonas]MCF5144497.1 hypothetical protein [Pseudomonas sp. PA-6-3C]MCF5145873.1 hypothetical protein [Pseudomonas sp. PA-6-3F]MCF5158099.1 hypothetical protein [Pseudomonas sp. PA-6-2E]MCF5176733.1 hypothetical protein [Pseudomonas sp. PA-6-1D]MCF5191406.1 hypothetical protein [Pseudomonas sp. PA-6-1H]
MAIILVDQRSAITSLLLQHRVAYKNDASRPLKIFQHNAVIAAQKMADERVKQCLI